MKVKYLSLAAATVALAILVQVFTVLPTSAQGSGCYNPCLNAYRQCQARRGRYNKACRQSFARCWRECNKDVGSDNPMPPA
ncbi:MAG TPA: hypothetical protein VF507_03045 [Pyrinomonadaceae bacterium]